MGVSLEVMKAQSESVTYLNYTDYRLRSKGQPVKRKKRAGPIPEIRDYGSFHLVNYVRRLRRPQDRYRSLPGNFRKGALFLFVECIAVLRESCLCRRVHQEQRWE